MNLPLGSKERLSSNQKEKVIRSYKSRITSIIDDNRAALKRKLLSRNQNKRSFVASMNSKPKITQLLSNNTMLKSDLNKKRPFRFNK